MQAPIQAAIGSVGRPADLVTSQEDHRRLSWIRLFAMMWVGTWLEACARRELRALSRLVFGRMVVTPAVQAAIDQHAAAIRDILSLSPGRIGPVELAGYARGVEDGAFHRGWLPAADLSTDWVGLRLAAACSLAAARTGDVTTTVQ